MVELGEDLVHDLVLLGLLDDLRVATNLHHGHVHGEAQGAPFASPFGIHLQLATVAFDQLTADGQPFVLATLEYFSNLAQIDS